MADDITELGRIDVLAMVLQGRDGDHPSEFWRSRAHRLLNHREPLYAVLGLADSGLMYCTAHHGVIECDEGDGPCDNASDHRDAIALHPCPICKGTFVDPDDEDEECSACDEGVTRCAPTPMLYQAPTKGDPEDGPSGHNGGEGQQ